MMGGVPDDFLIATNPEENTTLPYLLRIPLGERGIILKAKERWPRTAKVYCHPAQWPEGVEILEQLPVRSCVRRGAAIDLVLERGRENRSQFVMTRVRGGREAIFWQSRRTTKMARPAASLPSARASGVADMEIHVDTHERYGWRFDRWQAHTVKSALPVGDYAVRDGDRVVAAVERKTLEDFVATLTSGKLKYVLADLAALPHAAVVVEERYSKVFALERVRPATVADGIAECQVAYPNVPIVFTETRPLAQEWTYRFFGAALAADADDAESTRRLVALPSGTATPEVKADAREIRAWAQKHGFAISDRGRIPTDIQESFRRATGKL